MLAIPRSFSQLTTSFVGSQCQGILPTLFALYHLNYVLLFSPYKIVTQLFLNKISRFPHLHLLFFIIQFSSSLQQAPLGLAPEKLLSCHYWGKNFSRLHTISRNRNFSFLPYRDVNFKSLSADDLFQTSFLM